MNWAALGAASGAYAEGSRECPEVAAVLEEHQSFRDELEFPKLAEQLIYQFNIKVLLILSNIW